VHEHVTRTARATVGAAVVIIPWHVTPAKKQHEQNKTLKTTKKRNDKQEIEVV